MYPSIHTRTQRHDCHCSSLLAAEHPCTSPVPKNKSQFCLVLLLFSSSGGEGFTSARETRAGWVGVWREEMEDVVKFVFGISGESVCSSSHVSSVMFLWALSLTDVFLLGFRKCHRALSLPIPGVSTRVAPFFLLLFVVFCPVFSQTRWKKHCNTFKHSSKMDKLKIYLLSDIYVTVIAVHTSYTQTSWCKTVGCPIYLRVFDFYLLHLLISLLYAGNI
jgi:hypothetical protein